MEIEYVIINKTFLQKRIEELESKQPDWFKRSFEDNFKINLIKEILSQSIPLIPEIEKAFNAGDDYRYWQNNGSKTIPSDSLDVKDYISNLKLDI